MVKKSLLIAFAVSFVLIKSLWAYDHNSVTNRSYPYTPKWGDIYFGVSLASLADVSANTGGNPEWGALYNPLRVMKNYGFAFNVGFRPLEVVPVLRGLRLEGELLYRESRYKTLYDPDNSWLQANKVPPYGKLYLSGVTMLNGYYDFRWFSNLIYPYVGFGLGFGKIGVRDLDYTMLADKIGEEYFGTKDRVPVEQFMAGLEYSTKILKASIFIEYRYQTSGRVTIYPHFTGDQNHDSGDDNKKDDKPVIPPPVKDLSFKAHEIVVGFKYYLY